MKVDGPKTKQRTVYIDRRSLKRHKWTFQGWKVDGTIDSLLSFQGRPFIPFYIVHLLPLDSNDLSQSGAVNLPQKSIPP